MSSFAGFVEWFVLVVCVPVYLLTVSFLESNKKKRQEEAFGRMLNRAYEASKNT
jgi:hypothetical protein